MDLVRKIRKTYVIYKVSHTHIKNKYFYSSYRIIQILYT